MISIPKIPKITGMPNIRVKLPSLPSSSLKFSKPLPPFLLKLDSFASCRTFGLGMGGVFLFCLVLFAYVSFMGPKTIAKIETGFEATIIPLPNEIDGNADVIDIAEYHDGLTSLPPAPIRGLYEIVKGKVLPVKSVNGVTVFHAYKRPVPNIHTPVIAIAIEDFGLSEALAENALEVLPADVTFILSPYAKDVNAWQQKAREAGHEIWLSVPIETGQSLYKADTGAYTLTTKANANQNTATAYTLLSLTSGYAGLAIFSDNVLASRPQSLIAPLDDILSRGLGVLELNPDNKTPLVNYFTSTKDTPYVRVSPSSSDYVFEQLELIAKTNGFAVATLPPFPKTFEKLKNWAQTLPSKKLQLVPVSAISTAMKKKNDTIHQGQSAGGAGTVVHRNEMDHINKDDNNADHHE